MNSSVIVQPRRARRTAPVPAPPPAARREAGKVASTAADQSKRVGVTAVSQTKAVLRTADQDFRELSDSVRSQADQVKAELASQARGLLAETRDQVQAEADAHTLRFSSALFQVGSQAVALANGRPQEAGPLVDYAERIANWLDTVAAGIEERGLEGLTADAADLARRRPGVFLAGAAVVGLGVGRLIRSGAVSPPEPDTLEA